MASWLVAYANSFVRADKIFFDYLTTKKDSRLWIGTVESILAFSYLRFRQGAKFRLQKGFRITNDHSHPVKVGDYEFNLQGVKRSFFGGTSMDLLNFKTPIFYSLEVLQELKPKNREILLKLAIESVNAQLITYDNDVMATEALNSIKRILEVAIQGDRNEMECRKKDWYINEEYWNSPLTQRNIELWKENIDILNRICYLFDCAHRDFLAGRDPEGYLNEIRDHQENIREKLEGFLMQIPKGRIASQVMSSHRPKKIDVKASKSPPKMRRRRIEESDQESSSLSSEEEESSDEGVNRQSDLLRSQILGSEVSDESQAIVNFRFSTSSN
jgi:hypothetical protein